MEKQTIFSTDNWKPSFHLTCSLPSHNFKGSFTLQKDTNPAVPRYLSLSWIPSRFEPSICEVTLCTSATFPGKCSTWESNQHDRVEVATENTHHRQGVTSGAQPLPPTPRERMLWDRHALEVTMEGKCVLPIYSTPVAVDAEVEHRPCTFFIFNYFSTMGKKRKRWQI